MEIFNEYFKKDNLLSRVDARVKLGVSLIILAMALSYKGILFPLLILCVNFALCVRIKIPLKVFLLRLSEPVFIASVIILLKFLSSGQEAIFSIKIFGLTITGYKDGLIDGLRIASRILGAVSVVSLLGFSTPFTEIIGALSWLRVPKGFIEVLMFAYRYIFVLLEDAMVIYNAQKNRLGYSNIKTGLVSFGTLVGSLILKAFEHSHNITVSMIQRGYNGNVPVLKDRPFKIAELLVSAMIIIVMGIVWKI